MEKTVRELAAVFDKEVARKAYSIRKKTSSVVTKQNEFIIQLLDEIFNNKTSNTNVLAESERLKNELERAQHQIEELKALCELRKVELIKEQNTVNKLNDELMKFKNLESNVKEIDLLQKENNRLKAHNGTHQNTIKDITLELKKSVTIEYNMNEEVKALKNEREKMKANNSTLQDKIFCFEKEIKSKDNVIAKLKLHLPKIHRTENVNIVRTTGVVFNPVEPIQLKTNIQDTTNENYELKRKIEILKAESTCFDPTNTSAKVKRLLKDKTAAKQFIEYQREGWSDVLDQLQEAQNQGYKIKEINFPDKEFKAEDVASNEIDDSYEETAETSEEDTSYGNSDDEESSNEIEILN